LSHPSGPGGDSIQHRRRRHRSVGDTSAFLQPGVRPREVIAWSSLDFANSGYTTVVLTAVFNVYFVSTVASGNTATLLWTVVLALSYFLVMLSAPLLGAYADLRARKRVMLLWCTLACTAATLALATVGPGMVVWAAILLVISNLAYATHQDLTAAFLPELARQDSLGRLSGYGWAWGYCGGLVALALALLWVRHADSQALGTQSAVGGTMLITGAMFALIGLPSLWVLRERAKPLDTMHRAGLRHWVSASWGRLAQTWLVSRHQIDLRRFLLCVLVYQAGVQTVITLAAVYAREVMGFNLAQTISLVLVVNITAAAGAWAFGHFQDRLGHLRSLVLTLLVWLGMVGVAWQATSEAMFWLAANLAGLAMGASQSGGRAAIAYLALPGRQAETFGLWGVSVNASAIVGPLAYGLITWISGNDHRLAMLATGTFFLIGLMLLLRVDFTRGRQLVMRADRPEESA
jgi:UMF1 family MFS transporter